MGDVPPTLLSRVRGEYAEMPGLALTPRQAARLLGIERAVSEHLLAALVESGFLWRNRDGAYIRATPR